MRGSWSFRLYGGLPRGVAVLCDRRPMLSCFCTPARRIPRRPSNRTFVAVPHLKKREKVISSHTVSTNDRAEQSCLKLWQQRTDLVRCLEITIWTSTAVQLLPDAGLGCPTRCLAAHTVPSEELRQDSALFAVWTRVLWRDQTLREDSVLQVRWGTWQAATAMGGMLQVDAGAAIRSDG